MGSSRGVFSTPVLVFGVTVIAFVGWVAYTAAQSPAPARPAPLTVTPEEVLPPPQATVVLCAIHPGSPRAVVDRQLITFPPPLDEPVDVSGGTPVCRARYRIHLKHPVSNPDLIFLPSVFTPGPYIITLEFDGAVVGHPLVRATIAPAPER